MDQKKIIDLYLRCRNHTATAEEQEEFRLLLMNADTEEVLNEFWDSYWNEETNEDEPVQVKHYEQIFDAIVIHPKSKPYKRNFWPKIAAAAAIFIIAGGLFYMEGDHLKKDASGIQTAALNEIAPGSNKAYLTLADGKRITLTDAVNGKLANQSGVQITKAGDGKLIYTISEHKREHWVGAAVQNTIETPRGGQYQVNLPDGSRVWLNADSRLSYPVSFAAKKERVVELTGEAYFEIAKDKQHPFKVKSSGQEIEVLGTHFNVNSYRDEPAVKTTLLEGSVKVTCASGQLKGLVLKPGQQSIVSGTELNVKSVDVNDVVDWKNGEFVFDNEPLPNIMRKVSRWYNVDIEYVNPGVKTNTFTGSVSKSDKITNILKMLQKTSKIRFTIEGSKISIE